MLINKQKARNPPLEVDERPWLHGALETLLLELLHGDELLLGQALAVVEQLLRVVRLGHQAQLKK